MPAETPTGRARVAWCPSWQAWRVTVPGDGVAYYTCWRDAFAQAERWAAIARRQLALRARAAVVPG